MSIPIRLYVSVNRLCSVFSSPFSFCSSKRNNWGCVILLIVGRFLSCWLTSSMYFLSRVCFVGCGLFLFLNSQDIVSSLLF